MQVLRIEYHGTEISNPGQYDLSYILVVAMMRKLDDALRHVKEAEAAVKQRNTMEAEEAVQLLTRCEELEQEVAYLNDQLQDQR